MPSLLLLHSPLVGPSTWLPLAEVLRRRGYRVDIPDLRPSLEGPPPYWRGYADLAAELGRTLEGDIVLVGHSGAGRILPAVAAAIGRPPAAYLFIDAGLPYNGETHLSRAPDPFLDMLSTLVGADGRLAPWTSWWSEDLMSSLVPDPTVRAAVRDDCPRVPLSLLHEPLPVPASWPDAPCCYLSFTYEDDAAEAQKRGWPTRRLNGSHLHAVVDPIGVAGAMTELLAAVGVPVVP